MSDGLCPVCGRWARGGPDLTQRHHPRCCVLAEVRLAVEEAARVEREACAALAEQHRPPDCSCEECRYNCRGAHPDVNLDGLADAIRERGRS